MTRCTFPNGHPCPPKGKHGHIWRIPIYWWETKMYCPCCGETTRKGLRGSTEINEQGGNDASI